MAELMTTGAELTAATEAVVAAMECSQVERWL